MLKKLIFVLVLLINANLFAQDKISGQLFEIIDDKENAVPGITVFWSDNLSSAVTDTDGNFSINIPVKFPGYLVAKGFGFQNDTTIVENLNNLKIVLTRTKELKEIEITAKRQAITVSTQSTINVERVTQKELLRAACCNLSEAFESNPSVNVSYKDAVTGIKEIQLLGLGGSYVQMLNENTPNMKGLTGIYGLTFIPGPWIQSIQLTKGAGSVINGYESVTGQINIEYKKPLDTETPGLYLNVFSDEKAGNEANVILTKRFKKNSGTTLFLHAKSMMSSTDRNNDGFMDIPDEQSVNIYNRWEFIKDERVEVQFGIKFLKDGIYGGQTDDVIARPLYKTNVQTTHAEILGKLGIVYPDKPGRSIGNIFSASVHDIKSSFGLKNYNANEKNLYIQSIYQDNLWSLSHSIKTGVSFRYNIIEEKFITKTEMQENIPGVFLEYTYSYFDKLTIVAGLREDLLRNNEFIFTPRFHAKYNFNENFIVRISGGKSYRTPYLIADHLSVLASSRQIIFVEDILPEKAWNYGINLTRRFQRNEHEGSFAIDLYRTEFINQLVVDTYSDSSSILFYNLNGESYSNSFQVSFNTELINHLDLRLAYKFEDVKSTFNGRVEAVPLSSRDRALASLSYSTNNEHWKFDYTFILEGPKKLQNTYYDEGAGSKKSPSFFVMNFQVTKVFKRFEIYGGAENLLDYRQENPIINADNPFGNNFDATNIWGPVAGRRIYAGLRISFR